MHEMIYLNEALALAKIKRGFCSPNPAVGAVVVKHNQIIAKGYHERAGAAHAEVMALQTLSQEESRGATLYVTLEPCCTHGRTPPCTQLLIEREIAEVIYAYQDPNPAVLGRGAEQLRQAGIHCTHLALPEINAFYQSYTFWQQHRKPRVQLKLALSADGKVAGANKQPVMITGDETHLLTHEYRKKSDAILTTAKTIQADNPKLTVRLATEVVAKPIYVLDQRLITPLSSQVFETAKSLCFFYRDDVSSRRTQVLKSRGIECVCVPAQQQRLDLNRVLELIGQDGIHDLWVEAGPLAFTAFIQAGLAHRVILYHSPRIIGPEGYAANLPNDLLASWTPTQSFYSGEDRVEVFEF